MPGTLPRSSAFLARMDAITPAGRPPASGSSTTARTVDIATRPRGIRAHTYQGNRGTVGAGRVAAVGDCPETRVVPPALGVGPCVPAKGNLDPPEKAGVPEPNDPNPPALPDPEGDDDVPALWAGVKSTCSPTG